MTILHARSSRQCTQQQKISKSACFRICLSYISPMPRLLLASASPRRAELLKMLGIPFAVRPAALDESIHLGERHRDYAVRMAEEKARAVLNDANGTAALGADTIVVWEETVFGKPQDRTAAANMLRHLADSWHEVLTGVCLATADGTRSALSVSRVHFGPIPEPVLTRYLDTGEYRDKSGSYGIQGPAAAFIRRIEGSHTGGMGLPLYETTQMLREAGLCDE